MRRSFAIGVLAALASGVVVAHLVNRALRIEVRSVEEARPGPRIASAIQGHPARSGGALPIRLVDLGAVGIPSDTASWGHDYSHNSKAFHRLILDSVPYIDEAQFRRVRAEWSIYVRRVAAYGNNGIIAPLFLELITLDSLPDVYRNTRYAERHRMLQLRFRELFALARESGLSVYLATDLAPLTPPLADYLGRHGGVNEGNDHIWSIYRQAFAEALDRLPEVQGVVVRIGEAGRLYNRATWPYGSAFLIHSVTGVRRMLRELLPVFEARHRTLVLRSWTVGVGEIGDLHTDPAVYARALDEINSSALVVATKVQAGDFFRGLPLNPTLLSGRQKRIVELQARREFEGFGAFPNYLAGLYGPALRQVRASNPEVAGTWVWTQNGGPLRAGPMSLYPLQGFWLWTDANVYASSQLALDPAQTPADLAAEWVRHQLTSDTSAVSALTELLLLSPDAIERGYYIRPFAAARVSYAGYELPPLLWIMEWNIVGGWSAVWSLIYRVIRPRMDEAIQDGFQALGSVSRMQRALEQAEPALAGRGELPMQMRRSLAYEASLLTALAWYRAAFLEYYRWLDRGDSRAYARWQKTLPLFESHAREHQREFGADRDFPAFDFSLGIRSAKLARRAASDRWIARGLLAAVVLSGLVALTRSWLVGTPGPGLGTIRRAWLGACMPWRLAEEKPTGGSSVIAAILVLVLLTLTAATVFSFASLWPAAAVSLVLGSFVVSLAIALTVFDGPNRSGPALAALAPLIWPAVVLLAIMSIRGPLQLWYLLWTGGPARDVLIICCVAAPLMSVLGTIVTARAEGATAVAAALLIAAAAALLATALLYPGPEPMLAALNDPLGLVPMTYAVIVGAMTYADFPPLTPWLQGATIGFLLGGVILGVRSRRRPTGRF